MLALAIFWYSDQKEYEPLIVIFGQLLALLPLLFEKKVANIFTKDVDTSKIRIKKHDGDSIHTEAVKNSDIDIS